MAEQGEIYTYDFGPQSDNRMEGPHPAVVVQTDLLNRLDGYMLTIVVPVSTKGRNSPSHIKIEPSSGNGLAATSFVKCEQIYTVPKSHLVERRGKLSQQDLFLVKEALKAVLAI